MRPYLIFSVVYFFRVLLCVSQTPVTDFNVSPNACLLQQLQLNNNSTGATSHEWDFCANDSETLLLSEDLATITGLNAGTGYKVVSNGTSWYGFVVSQNNHSLYRLDFGNSPLNLPTVNNLGNPGGQLLFPNGIEIFNHAGNWYGFVGLFDPNAGIVRLDFGTSLTTTPTAQNLGMFGLNGRFWGVRVIEQAGDLILVVINRNANSIVRINYRNSFDNPINNATHVFSHTIAGANLTPGFDIVNAGADWIALIASDLNNSVIQIKFTNDILSAPTVESTYTTNIVRPQQIKILKEGVRFVAAITSESSNLKIVDFKDLNPVNPPTEVSHAGLPTLLSTDVTRYQGKSILHGVGSTTKLRNLVFQSECGASFDFSGSVEPSGIAYNTAGTKSIELRSLNEFGSSSDALLITVSTSTAPDINFTSNGVCTDHNVHFEAVNSSGNVTGYEWDFGDAGSSTDPEPDHTFTSSGDFETSLTVTASNGCSNFVSETISIFDEPVADFTIPAATPYCTNQAYVFDNATSFDSGYPPAWQWKINGTNTSNAEDLTYAFTGTGNQDITLVASIPGCESEKTRSIASLTEGADVNFSFSGQCEGEAVVFANNTTGSVTAYLWDFDDGNNSIDTSPSYAFPEAGTYDVTLTASNASGCNNSLSKQVVIYSKPQVDFSLSPPPFSCNGTSSVFNDLTPDPDDSNLSTWLWNFDDAGSSENTSEVRNAQHIYANAGNYNVSLTVTTNFSCTATTEIPVTISETPVADFIHAPPCEDRSVLFSDASSGIIESWNWMIGSTTYSVENPAHMFVNPGNFNAALTVTADNGCVGSVSKTIVVPATIAPDFTVTKNCVQQQTQFTDITNDTADPVSAYSWNFGGQGTATGSPATFTFANTGNVNVTLSVTTQTGCIYPVTKAVNIIVSPQANFTATPEAGAPPLNVQFTNASSNATSYLWSFNDPDNTTSTAVSPSFTYETIDEYIVDLTASNAQQCTHTFSRTIQVVEPVTNIALSGLELIEFQSGSFKPAVTIYNHGNVSVNGLNVLIDISGPVIREHIDEEIEPNSSYRHVFQFEFPEETSLEYFCVEAEITDLTMNDNRTCLSIQQPITIFPPYPNPARGTLNVDWILNEDGIVYLTVVNSMGQEIESIQVNSSEGLNPFVLNTGNLGAGVYFLKVNYQRFTRVYRIFVSE